MTEVQRRSVLALAHPAILAMNEAHIGKKVGQLNYKHMLHILTAHLLYCRWCRLSVFFQVFGSQTLGEVDLQPLFHLFPSPMNLVQLLL